MSTATITFTDLEDGQVNMSIDFGDEGANDKSGAHRTAVNLLERYVRRKVEEDEDDEA